MAGKRVPCTFDRGSDLRQTRVLPCEVNWLGKKYRIPAVRLSISNRDARCRLSSAGASDHAIEEHYRISFWDGLVLAAAEAGGAQLVYTEDLNHGQKYGAVTVENPFRA